MKLKKASSKNHEELIAFYKMKPLERLKLIQPRWAYDVEEKHICNKMQLPIHSSHTIFIVNTKELIKNSNFDGLDFDTLFTNNILNDGRIARLLFQWDNKGFVDPPTAYLNQFKGKIGFDDGRHRTKLAYFLDFPEIPIALANEDVHKTREIIELRKP